MIFSKPTENLTGITLEGDLNDFYEIVEAIYRMTGIEESYKDPYWGVENRLLGLCYDIRHAYMGDREIRIIENGVDDELMRCHSTILPKKAVHYCANCLFPEAVFVAFSIYELCIRSRIYYGNKGKRTEEIDLPPLKYSDYLKDKALLELLAATILDSLAEVIGADEFEKLLQIKNRQYESIFMGYATQYVDKCNIEYLKTPIEKRKDKIRNISKRLLQKPDAYKNMKYDLENAARSYGCSYHEIHDSRLNYPEEIEW